MQNKSKYLLYRILRNYINIDILKAICLIISILYISTLLIINYDTIRIDNFSMKLLFIHLSTAWIGVLALLLSGIYSILLLFNEKYKLKMYIYALKAELSCKIGLILVIFTTIIGIIWSSYAWNSMWNWDIRNISILVLIIYYIIYIYINNSIKYFILRLQITSIYLVIGMFNTIYLIFLVPRIYESLHPNLFYNYKFNMELNLITLLLSFSISVFIICYYIYKYLLQVKIGKLIKSNDFSLNSQYQKFY